MNITIDTNKLFWEKYRPTTLDEIILPDRILKYVESGIQSNMIFYGSSGLGKTTLAKILIKDHPHIIFTSKLGVEVLRTKIATFCKQALPFEDPQNNKIRVVYFEEFDRASSEMQEELKSFIEDYSHRVRFIATSNNISKIDPAITSRMKPIDFRLKSDEVIDIKKRMAQRVSKVLKEEGVSITKPVLINIFKNSFPDFRQIWQSIQYYTITGIDTSDSIDDQTNLFEMVLSNSNSVKIWEYLDENWSDKIELAFQAMGREFFDWIKLKHSDKDNKLAEYVSILSEFSDVRLGNSLDPFVTLNAFIFKANRLFNN